MLLCFRVFFLLSLFFFFFFNDTATTEIYTLSLHDALPFCREDADELRRDAPSVVRRRVPGWEADRKSTRLNSSHVAISYAVFCLKKKKTTETTFFYKKKKKKQQKNKT